MPKAKNETKTTRWWYVTMWDMSYDYAAAIERGQFLFIRRGGLEYAPKTGKEHRHCIFYSKESQMKTKKGFGIIAKHINAAINPDVDWMKGKLDQGTCYSEKDNPSEDYGIEPRQGKRTDLDDIKNEILSENTTVDQIALNKPELFHQYGRTLNKIEDLALRRKYRTWMTTCEWIYGKSGVGKSHKAFENYHPATHYIYPNDNGWWDGYTGQETVIINEFRGQIQYYELLDLIDKWPKTVKRRNREPVPFLAKHIIITSSMAPSQVYCNLEKADKLEQLLRRCIVNHLKDPKVV